MAKKEKDKKLVESFEDFNFMSEDDETGEEDNGRCAD